MGKTMVSLALVMAHPAPADFASAGPWESQHGLHWKDPRRSEKVKVHTTLICTTPVLLGQWYDQIKQFAPSLKVVCCHNSDAEFTKWRALLAKGELDLHAVDVLLVSSRFQMGSWPMSKYCFWRLIVDEFHVVGKTNAAHFEAHPCPHTWGVSGTPFATPGTADPVLMVLRALGLPRVAETMAGDDAYTHADLRKWKQVMIRHTKDNSHHARGYCVKEAFGEGKNTEFCSNCFCYVCDTLASTCTAWESHL